MKKLLYLSFVLGAFFLTASCERELVQYEPEAGEIAASFLTDKAIVALQPEDGNKFTVDLYRGITGTAVSVPVVITDYDHLLAHDNILDATTSMAPVVEDGLYFIDGNYTALGFTETAEGTPTAIPAADVQDGFWIADADGFLVVAGADATTVVECMDSEVSFDFAAADAKATLTLTYPDINAIPYAKNYSLDIYIVDVNQVAVSGYDEMEVVAYRPATRQDKGVGVWTSAAFGKWPQAIYNYAEAPNLYTLPDLFTEKYDVCFTYEAGAVVFPDYIDTMIMYDEDLPDYGTFYFILMSPATLSDGVITLNTILYLPAASYSFGSYANSYALPEGFTFE